MSSSPLISVIIPTYERPELLQRCLGGLCAQDLPADRYEVVVVDDGSGPATADVLRDFEKDLPQLVWFAQPVNLGPAAARNRGIDLARSDCLLFLDDDIVATPSLVRTHWELHSGGDPLLGILGRVRWHPDLRITPFMRWLDTVDLQFAFETGLAEGRIHPAHEYFYTCNLSLSRALVVQAGGFNEAFPYPAHEDTELAMRLCRIGFKLDYRPSALAWNSRPITLKDFCHRMMLVGESSVILRALEPESESGPEVIPAIEPAWRRLSRRLLKLIARLVPLGPIRGRYYRSEIWQAQMEGIRRGQARVETWNGSPSSPAI